MVLPRPIGRSSDVGAFQSGPLVVNSAADSDGFGLLTLRNALNIANVDTTTTSLPITFDPTVFDEPKSITLTAGTLTIGAGGTVAPITLTGPSAGLTISGDFKSTVFTVASNATATLSELTIADGSSTAGGGIYNSGTLTVNASTLSENTATGNAIAGRGGAIFNHFGSLTIINSTLANNSANSSGGAGGLGGAIFNFDGSALLVNDTLDFNNAQPVNGTSYSGGSDVYNLAYGSNNGSAS